MGMIDSCFLLPVTTQNADNYHLGEIIDANDSGTFYHTFENKLKNSICVIQAPQLNTGDCSRIEALKEDLIYFRRMLDQMVQQKPDKMDCYASLLKSCNSTLRGNSHKMHKKYLDLLNKTQAHEAKLHLRALESELAMLTKNKAQ